MEIGSVVSNAYAKATVQGERTEQAQLRRVEEQESRAREQSGGEESPRPVANAQGQTTGQVINVTA